MNLDEITDGMKPEKAAALIKLNAELEKVDEARAALRDALCPKRPENPTKRECRAKIRDIRDLRSQMLKAQRMWRKWLDEAAA